MIIIGITTYNRLNILKRMSKSLYTSNLHLDYTIWIYDDASDEYGVEVLREVFPNVNIIRRNKINIGADANTWQMYMDFVDSDAQYFLNADSDLIFAADWMDALDRYMPMTDGVLSLLNADSHKVIAEKGDLCLKKDLGAAGTVFSKKAMSVLIEEKDKYTCENKIDWGFSDCFNDRKICLYSTRRSYVQHVGISGYNSRAGAFDFGKNFVVDSLSNGQILNDTIEELSVEGNKNIVRTMYNLFPFEQVPYNSRIVIYGAGRVGRDYIRQINRSGYCKIVATIDKEGDGEEILPVTCIKDIVFDYIVLATCNEEYISEMKKKLEEIDTGMIEKIVFTDRDRSIHI